MIFIANPGLCFAVKIIGNCPDEVVGGANLNFTESEYVKDKFRRFQGNEEWMHISLFRIWADPFSVWQLHTICFPGYFKSVFDQK